VYSYLREIILETENVVSGKNDFAEAIDLGRHGSENDFDEPFKIIM